MKGAKIGALRTGNLSKEKTRYGTMGVLRTILHDEFVTTASRGRG